MKNTEFTKMFWNSMPEVPEPLRTRLLKNGFWWQKGLILYARTSELSEIYTVEDLRNRAAMLHEFADWLEKNNVRE